MEGFDSYSLPNRQHVSIVVDLCFVWFDMYIKLLDEVVNMNFILHFILKCHYHMTYNDTHDQLYSASIWPMLQVLID